MAYQVGANYYVNIKEETVVGTAATGGAATGERLRTLDSPGLKLGRVPIQSEERRADGNMGKVRLGSKSVTGSYNMEMSQASFESILAGLLRNDWTSPVTITFDNGAALTSLEVTDTNEVTFAGTTTPVAAGLRVGDVFRLANMSNAANNGINCVVAAIAGSVVTTRDANLTVQSADTACTLTIAKKLKQGTTPVRKSFTVEQYQRDMDESELFVGCRVVSLSLAFQPDNTVRATVGFVGLNRSRLETGSAPYFTSPTEYTTINLIADDASIMYNGAVVTDLTGWTVNFAIGAQGQPVLGSLVGPDVYDGRLTATGQVSATVEDLSDIAGFDAETEFEMAITLVEPESEPKSFVHLHFGAVKVVDIDGPLGGDAAYVRTRQLYFCPRVAATGYDAGICTISTAA